MPVQIKKILFIFLSAISFSTFALDAESTNAKIQAALDQTRIQNAAPAMQVSVSLPGEYASRNFVSGTTKLNGKNKITTDSLFQIGSNTKAFVAVLILQLETQGKLNINDAIDKYIDFSKHPTWPQEWQNVTIKQLLNMTSGIDNYTEDKNFIAEVTQNPDLHFTATQLINIAAKHPDYFAPGKSWYYSNTDYILAGKIIENVTGQTVTQNINEKLLGSTHLNLLNTHYAGANNYSRNTNLHAVSSYDEYPGEEAKDESSKGLSWANSAGCMLSNTSDLTRWIRSLFSGKTLASQQLHEMKSLVCWSGSKTGCTLGQPVSSDGFGFALTEQTTQSLGKVWIYEGSTLATDFIYYWIPSYDTVISVTADIRNDKNSPNKLANKIVEILMQSRAWKNYRVLHSVPTLDASQLKTLQSTLKFPLKNKLT